MKTILLLLFTTILYNGYSQCSTTAMMSGSSFSSDASIGSIGVLNPSHAQTNNGTVASATALIIGDNSNYLVAKGFGFSIPATYIICGVTVTAKKGAYGVLANVTDNSVMLVKNSAISSIDHADISTAWPLGLWPLFPAYTTVSYGSSSDTWGLALTPADVNSANFGVAISTNLGGIAVLPTSIIDYIGINVSYSLPLNVQFLHFNAVQNNNQVVLKWAITSDGMMHSYLIDRSLDGEKWNTIDTMKSSGTQGLAQELSYTDQQSPDGNVYYRIRSINTQNNDAAYSDVVQVNRVIKPDFFIYPNTFSDCASIYLSSEGDDLYSIEIHNATGNLVRSIKNIHREENNSLCKEGLYPGIYYCRLISESKGLVSTGKIIID